VTIEVALKSRRGSFVLDAEFSVPASGVTALFGPSGSGKTTILRAIAGLERLAGRVVVNEEIWQDEHRFLPPHRRRAGMVFSGVNLLPHLSVGENLRFARRAGGGDVEAAIAATGIAPLLGHRPAQLSAGESQRVAIARALAAAPRLLLLDEPLSGLDDEARSRMLDVLAEVFDRSGLPAIYVSHAREEIARLTDRVLLVAAGRVAAQSLSDIARRIAGEFPDLLLPAPLSAAT
jgi:molybdate transport system ATP-binding protein